MEKKEDLIGGGEDERGLLCGSNVPQALHGGPYMPPGSPCTPGSGRERMRSGLGQARGSNPSWDSPNLSPSHPT